MLVNAITRIPRQTGQHWFYVYRPVTGWHGFYSLFACPEPGNIHYYASGPGDKKVKGGPVFNPAGCGKGGVWQLDPRNVQPKLLANTRNNKKQKAQKTRRTQKTQPHAQTSMVAAVLTDTEVEGSDSSFTLPETDKSFGAKGYDDKNPNKKWPRASATTEGKWTRLLNAVQAAMHAMYAKSFPNPSAAFPFCPMDVITGLPKCIWSSQFSNTPVPDNTNAQKPDIILHTESELNSTIPLYCGSVTKGYLLMREQPWRRFVMVFSIACNKLRLHYFDRSGLIISHPVSIVADSVRLLEVLNTLMLAHTSTLSYDPTMHMCDPTCQGTHPNLRENAKGWIEGPDKAHLSIMSVLWRSQGFFSHGTVCYRVQTLDGSEYALKDCWVAEDRRHHEVTILRMVEGIPNVVKLVANWMSSMMGNQTAHIVFELPMVHVLHGDLSPNNFVIHDGQGYFIDFDHAGIIAEGTNSFPSEGTGTRPYMSIRLLRGDAANEKKHGTVEHTASDDLESLFYIFVEFATTFDGPCGVMKDEGRRPMWVEDFENAGSDLWMVKQAYVLSPPIDKSLMDKTTPFFASFCQIIQEWRHLILAAASDPSDTPIGVTQAALASLLAKWISQLPPDAPAEIMVPMASSSSSRLGHFPHDNNIQSSAGPRHSMCIQQKA
ncbi:hypothetical protein C8R48DRAFT_674621 [Suillus tomentosus]|nr:hypothetical protein C8R48DRAFT_674621 [Suillus tomentosus]